MRARLNDARWIEVKIEAQTEPAQATHS